jgi:hypothetical protein
MGISFVFAFAPVPLTNEQSPLVHAAIVVRRHQEKLTVVAEPRYRIKPVPAETRPARLEKIKLLDELKSSTKANGDDTQS